MAPLLWARKYGVKFFWRPLQNVQRKQSKCISCRRRSGRRLENSFQGFAGDQLLSFAERHSAVAAAGHLSPVAGYLPFRLWPDRADLIHDYVHGFVVAAARGVVHRPAPQAKFPGDRHGYYAHWAGGYRVVGLSSGVVPRGAHGVRRAARDGAIVVSGRWKRRIGVGAAARDVYSAARPAQHCVVFVCGAAGDHPAGGDWRLGKKTPGRAGAITRGAARCARHFNACHLGRDAARAFAAEKDRVVAGHFGGADVFQIFLSCESRFLLHVLLDGQVSRVHSKRGNSFVRVSRRRGRGNVFWRAGGRPHGAQSGDLVFDSRRSALHADTALRKFVLDGNLERGDWIDSGFGVFHDPGFRAGTRPHKSGHDFGNFLRAGLWIGRNRRRVARETGGRDEHPFRIPGVFVFAGDGNPDSIPAGSESRGTQSLAIGSGEAALEGRSGLAALALGAFAAVDVIAVGAVVMAALAAPQFVNPMPTATSGFAGVADDLLIARIDVAGLRSPLVRKHAVLLFFGALALGNSRHSRCRRL